MAEHQSDSDRSSTARPSSPDEPQPVDPVRLSRYDLLLGSMLLVLLVAWLVGQLSSVPVWVAMAIGSLLAVPLVADGLAVNPPA